MTVIINLFGGPGAGKTTTCADIFSELKHRRVNVEMVLEVAKDFTWEKRHVALECQAYVFGKQYRNIERLMGQVDVIVTDAPLLASCIYAPDYYPPAFKTFVMDMYNRFQNYNYVIRRVKPYNPSGRSQTEDGARKIDTTVTDFLLSQGIYYMVVDGNRDAYNVILKDLEWRRPDLFQEK